MKKFTAIVLSIMLLVSGMLIFAGCGKEKPQNDTPSDHGLTGGDVVGGWTKAESPAITEDFRTVFERATSALTGMEYIPVAYLASQVVAGTNHCVLCKAAATVPGAETAYVIVYIYEDLNGNAQITGTAECGAQANLSDVDGGWAEPESPAVTQAALQAFTKASETLAGMEYTPVALLATQVVAGTNYRILCEARATVPDAETQYVILTVYEDPQGHAEITETVEFESAELTQIANPVEQYGSDMKSLEAAEEAVGFTLTVPESVTPENYVVISGMILEVDFEGGYLRKAKGSEDISGDYNAYDVTDTKTADGKTVTLKGNGGKVMLATWADGDYTYCVGISDGASEETILSLVNEIR